MTEVADTPTGDKVETKTEPIELTEKVETEAAVAEPKTVEQLQQELADEKVAREQADEDRRKEESRRYFLERKLEKGGKPEETVAPVSEDKPVWNPEGDEEYDDYLVKLTKWTYHKERQADQATERQTAFNKQLDKGFEKYEDFGKVGMKVDMSPAMIDALHDMDGAADVAQHLGKNSAEAHRIASLSPISAAREIGKIAERLSQPPKKIVKTTKAGEPIETITSGAAPTVGVDEAKMTQKERLAKWEKERLKAARGT